eukprot:TRINITY_DN20334_c0_g1_i1.p1 TRINITY_DN20334_c0_g1~~TRINITY_DN20334_c0_g1_i1.p1  ORF type:complete len:133 (+),score=11.70 TRINITY_DN20334_c0_g1_i1:53-400(+)
MSDRVFLTYGLEYTIAPLLACPFLYTYEYYGPAGALLGGALLTAMSAALALLRGESLRRAAVANKVKIDRMDPVYPTLVGILLCSFTLLQIILSVSHWSYYRDPKVVNMLGQGFF